MATKTAKTAKTTKKHHKKGKMPKGLRDYWAKMRANPKKKHHKKAATRHAPRKNPSPAKRASRRGAGAFIKSAGRQTMPLIVEALMGVLGYGGARLMASGAARLFPRKPTDSSDPFVLRLLGVAQFAAGAFLAIKVPKARGVGLGLCMAGIQDGIRRNVPILAPYLGADDETMLAYQPIEAPLDLGADSYYMAAPLDLGADNFLAAPLDLGADESERYGY